MEKCKTDKQPHSLLDPQGSQASGQISLAGEWFGFVKFGRGESLCLQGAVPISDKEYISCCFNAGLALVIAE